MNLNGVDYEKFRLCKEHGFVALKWEEAIDEITGLNTQHSHLVGNNFDIYINVFHPHQAANQQQTRYKVSISFRHYSDLGRAVYHTSGHEESTIEEALEYALWQATLIHSLLLRAE